MERFLIELFEKCKDYKIKVILDPTKVEFGQGNEVSGLYDSHNLELTVAINKPYIDWLPILVHESCHMDQHLENCKVWQECTIKDHDACNILDMWLSGVVDLNATQLEDTINRVLNMELDCERRSVEKIKKYKLPIDTTEYTQKANAYVYFYRAMMKTRKWTTKERSPYSAEHVWSQMPKKFYSDQTEYKIEDPLVDLIVKECF